MHAVKNDGFVKIEIGDESTAPSVVKIGKKTRERDVVRAVRIVEREWKTLLAEWRMLHGEEAADR